jgi:PST family polysaccharide transporter
MFITLFTEIGLGQALIQKQGITKRHLEIATSSTLVLALAIYLVLYLSAPFIAKFYREPLLNGILKLVGLSFIFTSLGNVSFSLLRKEMDFNAILIIEISSFLIGYGLVGVSMVFLGYGVWAYVVSIVVQSGIMTCMALFNRPVVIAFSWHKSEFKELFNFAGWLTLDNIINTVARQADVFVTGRILSINILGIYGRAIQLIDIPNQYIGMGLDNALFPAMALRQHDKPSMAHSFIRGIAASNLFMFPLSVFLSIHARPIIVLVFGDKWVEAAPIMQILCLSLPFKTTVKIIDSLVRAMGASRFSAQMRCVFALAMVSGAFVGCQWGLVGVAIGVNLAVFINYILMTLLSRKLVGFSMVDYFNTFLSGILLAVLTAVINLVILRDIFSYFYLSSLWQFILSSSMTCSALVLLLVFFPRIFGENWEWLFSQLLGYIPDTKNFGRIKSHFLGKLLKG